MKNTRKIALFDFDGTLTYKDSMFEFIVFYHGTFRFLLGMLLLSPSLVFHKFGLISAQNAKEKVLTFFFKKEKKEIFVAKATDFSLTQIPKIIRASAIKELHQLKNNNYEIYVVSASASLWLNAWCKQLNVNLIATELEINNGYITGKLEGNNCNGIEKVNRIKNVLGDSDYIIEFAYGDSGGDKEMLLLAKKSFYKTFI